MPREKEEKTLMHCIALSAGCSPSSPPFLIYPKSPTLPSPGLDSCLREIVTSINTDVLQLRKILEVKWAMLVAVEWRWRVQLDVHGLLF